MAKVKLLIIEDEFIIAESLAKWLNGLDYEVCEIADNGNDALRIYTSELPDLVLMDIHLSGKMDGVETAEKIREIKPVPLIFLTALSDAATIGRAKNAMPAAYVIKPFRRNDLKVAIEVALHNFSMTHPAEFTPESHPKFTPDSFYILQERIFVKNKTGRFEKIILDNILWIEADGSYSSIVTYNQKYFISVNISSLAEKIAHPLFLRVHRSYLVNLQKVDSFEESRLFINQTEIPVSKANRAEFIRRFIVI